MMSDGAGTLAKFFSIQSRKSILPPVEHPVETASIQEHESFERRDNGSTEVIEYEDFVNELKTSQLQAQNPIKSTNNSSRKDDALATSNAECVEAVSQHKKLTNANNDLSEDEAAQVSQASCNTTTLLKFFSVTGKTNKLPTSELSHQCKTKDHEIHPEETKKLVDRTKKRSYKKKKIKDNNLKTVHIPTDEDTSSQDADTSGNTFVPTIIDTFKQEDASVPSIADTSEPCEDIEAGRNSPSANQSTLDDTEVELCAMNTSVLSDHDVSRLITDSLIEAGIIQSPHRVKDASPVVVDNDSQLGTLATSATVSPVVCSQAYNTDSPVSSIPSSQASRISLRDVRRRLRERKLLSKNIQETPSSGKQSKPKRRKVLQVDSSEVVVERRRSSRRKSSEEQSCSSPKLKPKRLKKVKANLAEEKPQAVRNVKTLKKKSRPRMHSEKVDDNQSTADTLKVISLSTDDDTNPAEVASSQSSTPVRSKKRPKRSVPKDEKKRKLTDDDIVMVSAVVSSPSTNLREERLARLHAMSSKDDYSNLKHSKTVISLTQAEFFPKIGHVTQLPQDEEVYDCRLKLLPAKADTDITGQQTTLGLCVHSEPVLPAFKSKRSKLTAVRVKKELKKLQAFLPHYPVYDIYDTLDSRADKTDEAADQLWTSKYSPSTLSQLLVRKGYIEVINEWLLNWKKDIIKGQSSTRKSAKKKSSKKRNQFLHDSDSEEEEDEWTQTPILVLSGASGLGKTTCAYTIATLLGFKVFEMNPSMLRTSKTVMERVHESTRSQQVNKGKGVSIDRMFDSIAQDSGNKPARGIASFFDQMKKSAKKAEIKSPGKKAKNSGIIGEMPDAASSNVDAPDGSEAVSLSKLSLILFDEADVAFEEDKGFYETIKALGLEAKKPIVLTCQSTGYLRCIGVEHTHVEITPHIALEIAVYLCIVSLVENEVADVNAMLQLVNKFNCDIRKCLLQIQYLVCSGGLQSPSVHKQKTKPQKNLSQSSPVHQLARMCSHQSTLDILSTHHQQHLIQGSQSVSKLSSNPSRVAVDTGVVSRLSADPVTWSSVTCMKSFYTELIKGCFSAPKAKRLHSSELRPARVVLSVREELPPYIVNISDMELCLDYWPFFKAVCVAESGRKESKTSRRFLHYLAKQGLYLSDNDQAAILSLFSSSDAKCDS